jgi:hypothetical protein
MTYDHGRDAALIDNLLAQYDLVEAAETAAGLPGVADQAGIAAGGTAGRQALETLASHLFRLGRCRQHSEETHKALLTAIRVRQPSPAIVPSEEIARCESTFSRFNYRGEELDFLRGLLAVNERLVKVAPRSIETDRRTIERKTLVGPRMAYFTNSAWEAWLARYPGEAELADLDRQVEEERRLAEARQQNAERATRDAEIAQAQAAAARQRQAEAAEDLYLAMVERARARRATN